MRSHEFSNFKRNEVAFLVGSLVLLRNPSNAFDSVQKDYSPVQGVRPKKTSKTFQTRRNCFGNLDSRNLSSSWRCSKRSISIFRERFSSSREALFQMHVQHMQHMQHMQRCKSSVLSCHKLHTWDASKDHPFQAAAYEETFRHWRTLKMSVHSADQTKCN